MYKVLKSSYILFVPISKRKYSRIYILIFNKRKPNVFDKENKTTIWFNLSAVFVHDYISFYICSKTFAITIVECYIYFK